MQQLWATFHPHMTYSPSGEKKCTNKYNILCKLREQLINCRHLSEWQTSGCDFSQNACANSHFSLSLRTSFHVFVSCRWRQAGASFILSTVVPAAKFAFTWCCRSHLSWGFFSRPFFNPSETNFQLNVLCRINVTHYFSYYNALLSSFFK